MALLHHYLFDLKLWHQQAWTSRTWKFIVLSRNEINPHLSKHPQVFFADHGAYRFRNLLSKSSHTSCTLYSMRCSTSESLKLWLVLLTNSISIYTYTKRGMHRSPHLFFHLFAFASYTAQLFSSFRSCTQAHLSLEKAHLSQTLTTYEFQHQFLVDTVIINSNTHAGGEQRCVSHMVVRMTCLLGCNC